eukprot:6706525-Pyramimonas_sp.AAC.1
MFIIVAIYGSPPPCDWLSHQDDALFPPAIGSHIKTMLSFPLRLALTSSIRAPFSSQRDECQGT